MAYLDLLEELHRAIWQVYEDALVELIIADLQAPNEPCPSLYSDNDDDITW